MPRIKNIRFTTTDCGRCSGTGMYGPRSVAGGQCMACKGGRVVLTRAGRTARIAYDRAMDEALNVPLGDIAPGARVWSTAVRDDGSRVARYGPRWRVVASVTALGTNRYTRGPDGSRRPCVDVLVAFEDNEGGKTTTLPGAGQDGSRGSVLRVFDDAAVQRVCADIVARFPGAKAVYV